MVSAAKKTIGHTAIYAFGNILRNLASIIMLPIYTRYLTTADYGVLELLSMLIDFVGLILGMRLGEAIFRFYCNTSIEEEKNNVISTSLWLAISLNTLGVILIIVFSEYIATILFGNKDYAIYVTLFSFVLVLTAIIELSLVFVRAQQKPWLFVIISISRLLLLLSFNIYFVVLENMHVQGVIYSALIANSIIVLILLGYVFTNTGIRYSRHSAKELVTFSLPLMFAAIGAFYLTFGDRYFLRIYSGLSEVGIYALGYKFGFMLFMLTWGPISGIWDSQRYEIYNNNENPREIFQKTFLIVNAFMIFVALGIALFVKDVLKIMSAPEYLSAYEIVPIILVAYVIQAWTAYCNFGIMLGKRTIQITYGMLIAVCIITVAYLGLIPLFGGIGAAWATVIGFFARFLWVYYKSKRIYNMQLSWMKVLFMSSSAVFIYLLSLLIPENMMASIILRTILLILYIAIFFMLPIFSKDEKMNLIEFIKNPIRLRTLFISSR